MKLGLRLLAFVPFGTVLDDPDREGSLEANVTAGLFGFNPMLLQNLLGLGRNFPVKCRIL